MSGEKTYLQQTTGHFVTAFIDSSPVRFPQWNVVLSRDSLSPELKHAYRKEIMAFLRHCKIHRAPATAVTMKS